MISKVSTLALATIVGMTLCMPTNAMMRHYSATIKQSNWSLVKNTPTACVLEHQIPRFGKVNFSSVANKNTNLDFALDMLQKPAQRTEVELRSMPPQWKTGQGSRHITNLEYFREFDGEVLNKHAWIMLNELEKGMQPTFYYQDWYNDADSVSVSVSSVNFAPQHVQFMDCVSQLLRYSFDDIAFTTLNYLKNSNTLDRRSRNKLKMIQDYLKYEPEMELILVDSYTDSYGGREKNKQLSKQRANDMKKTLQDAGIAGDKIVVNGFGEKRHIAPNVKIQGRDSNRRVVITMNRGY
ncbi:MAG: OmpA family protein [Psychrobium sp.]|nr:OmpA family protein [Psychrobium sp.]